MQIRTDRGWIKAGLAVLVTGALGGGVLAVAGGTKAPRKVTADGVTGKPTESASANGGFDLGGVAPAAAAEAPKKDDPEVGDKIAVGSDGGSVTVSAVEDDVSAGRLFGAGEGQKYVAAEVKGCSGPHEKNLSFEPDYFLLRLDDGTMHDPGPPAKKPSLDGGGVPAGKCLSGWVTFVVKEGSLPTGVVYDGSSRLTWAVPPPKDAKPTTTTTGKARATTTTTDDDRATTSSTKPKTTATTARGTTATTSKSSGSSGKTTATTGKTTATTGKTTATSGKTTTTTGKSTATTSKSSGSTTTTGKSSESKPSTTTTTSRSVVISPSDPDD